MTGGRLSGAALLAKLAQGESGDNPAAVSSVGARGDTQFMPSSRQEAIRKFGVDPWRSADEAVHAAALHLRGRINGSTGLEGYNPGGGRAYVDYILGQKVGALGSAAAPASAATKPAAVARASSSSSPAVGGGSVLLAAFQSLAGAPAAQRQVSMPTAPSFAARPVGPQGLLPEPGATPAPSVAPDVSQALASAPAATSVPASGAASARVAAASQIAPAGSPAGKIAALVERANKVDAARLPYQWGGGHGARPESVDHPVPVDCSGAVSAILGVDPRVASQFKSFGSAGPGKSVTIWAKDTHVLLEVNGHFFGTSATNPGGGAGWIKRAAISPGYLRGFVARHPAGM